MTKIKFILLALVLMSASCGLFQQPAAAGVAKTTDGGNDWLSSNAIKDNKNASLSVLNISKLELDPGNHEVVYAGSFDNGIYKSEDSGGTWANILTKIGVYDFAINPTDGKTIYAAGIFAEQAKVLKTTDGGASWQQVYNEASGPSNAVRAVAINPANTNELVIGTSMGNVIKSSDGGNTWQLLQSFPNNKVMSLTWQQHNIYVLLLNDGLFLGTSDPNSFKSISQSITKNASTDYLYSTSVNFNQAYVDPLTPNLMYVTSNRGMFKSTDGGATWTAVSLPVQAQNNNPRPIAVAKTSSNIVYTSVGPVIYKSTDGGSTWQTQTVATNGYIDYILIDPQLPQIAYAGIYVTQ